eukprot:scaffold8495_cov37-Attheya_sp.AAC.1
MVNDIVLSRDGCGSFTPMACGMCNSGHLTRHWCLIVVPNSPYVDKKNGNHICGKAFCHMCALHWGSESQNYCLKHLDGSLNQDSLNQDSSDGEFSVDSTKSMTLAQLALHDSPATTANTNYNSSTNSVEKIYEVNQSSPVPNDVNKSLTVASLTEDSSTEIHDDFRMLVIGEVCGKKLLYDECKTIAHGLGFEICIRGFSFKCSRSSRSSDGPKQKQKLEFVPESKRRKPSSTQCGCQWTIRFQPHSPMSDEPLPPFVQADDTLVRITSLSLLHTNGCQPSLTQLTVTKKRSGTATRSIQMRRMRYCCRIFCEPGYVPYRFVRNQHKGLFPDTWIMDTKKITNFLVKCRLHKKEILEGCAVTIDENEPGWMKVVGADNSDHISRDLLQESMSKSSRVTEVQEYLNSLKTHDK